MGILCVHFLSDLTERVGYVLGQLTWTLDTYGANSCHNVQGLSIKYVDYSHNSVIFQYFETKFQWRIISSFL